MPSHTSTTIHQVTQVNGNATHLFCLLVAGKMILLSAFITHSLILFYFLAFDFCQFCVVIRFFHPCHNGQWPLTLKDFYTRSYPLHYFLILILEKEPVFPFSMLSAKQGNYWYHFYNVFGMTRSLTGDWTRDLPHTILMRLRLQMTQTVLHYTRVECTECEWETRVLYW